MSQVIFCINFVFLFIFIFKIVKEGKRISFKTSGEVKPVVMRFPKYINSKEVVISL